MSNGKKRKKKGKETYLDILSIFDIIKVMYFHQYKVEREKRILIYLFIYLSHVQTIYIYIYIYIYIFLLT